MRVSEERAKAIYKLWRRGVSIEELVIVTGFGENTIRGLLNSKKLMCEEIHSYGIRKSVVG